MTTQAEYDAGSAALLQFIQKEVQLLVPALERGFIPADKEPVAARAFAKVAIDAAAAVRAKAQQAT
jgi:hypothetical protein